MNSNMKLITLATTIGAAIVGIAYATPIVNLAAPLLSAGTHLADISTHGSGTTVQGRSFTVSLHTDGPASIATQDGAYGVGGINGWHSHPGMVIVTLISGSLEWFDENCNKTIYHAGDSWTEGSALHYFRVVGTKGLHYNATFITAHEKPPRHDEPAPACAAGLGLD